MSLADAERERQAQTPYEFGHAMLSEGELDSIELPDVQYVLKGLIASETINLFNGLRGGGKSWLMLAIGNEVTWGGEVGPWGVDQSVNTLIVDGEMPISMIQERLRRLNWGRDIGEKPSKLFIYPEAYAYRIGLSRADILDSMWRERMLEMMVDNDIRLLVLDNLASLAPGIDENDKLAFDPVNRWLLEMRFHGITTLMTHHTGKTGEQRGTSAHEDHVDLASVLEQPIGYTPDMGCRFVMRVTKDRAHITEGKEYLFQLDDDHGRLVFTSVVDSTVGVAVTLLNNHPGMTVDEAMAEGISRRTFYRAKARIKEGVVRG